MKKNFIFSILTIFISGFFLIISLLNPARSSTIIGPNAWPNVVLTATFILGVQQLVKAIIEFKNHVIEIENDKEEDKLLKNKYWYILGIIAVYVFVLPYIGFIFTTFILMILLFSIFGMRKKIHAFIGAVASNILFIVLFAHLLNITLPRGISVFEQLSFIFY